MNETKDQSRMETRIKLDGQAAQDLAAMQQGKEPPAPDLVSLPDVLTIPEVARLLRISRGAAYEAARRGKIPGVRRVGRSIRVSKRAVVDWLGQGRVSR